MATHELCYEDFLGMQPFQSKYGGRQRYLWKAFDASSTQPIAISDIDESITIIEDDDIHGRPSKLFVLVKPQAATQEETLEQLFRSHTETWKSETLTSSSLTNVAMHPSYQRIIGLGPKAVPLILRDLYDFGGPWFWALRALTGENPVPPEHRGNISLMTEDWLQWGYEHGHL